MPSGLTRQALPQHPVQGDPRQQFVVTLIKHVLARVVEAGLRIQHRGQLDIAFAIAHLGDFKTPARLGQRFTAETVLELSGKRQGREMAPEKELVSRAPKFFEILV